MKKRLKKQHPELNLETNSKPEIKFDFNIFK